jgi:hypothetical protein
MEENVTFIDNRKKLIRYCNKKNLAFLPFSCKKGFAASSNPRPLDPLNPGEDSNFFGDEPIILALSN